MRFLLSAAALIILSATAAHAAGPMSSANGVPQPAGLSTDSRRTVCTVTINSSEEKNAFKAKLPAKDFKFVELTEIGKSSPTARNDDWFQKACESKTQCDVLIISGHFAGSFFGSSKLELGLDEMERASCRNTCTGILNRPTETFLFGCNTLATKEKDFRTPEEYVAAQIHANPDMPIEVAQRNAQARYGAMGASFKERMRRVFFNVEKIRGFSSVGPTGSQIKPFLENGLKKIPDYRQHLQRIEAEALSNKAVVVDTALRRVNSSATGNSFPVSGLAECSGVMPNTVAAELRAQVCRLYSRKLTIAQKAQAAADMLKSADNMAFLPSVLSFIRENEAEIDRDPQARALLKGLLSEKDLWQKSDAMIASPNESTTIKVDLLRLNLALGRIDKATFESRVKSILSDKLRKLDASTVELACGLQRDQGLRLSLSSSEVDSKRLETNAGVSAFACLRSNDPEITRQVLRTFSVMENPTAVTYGLQGMLSLPSYNEERAEAARAKTYSGNPDVSAAALVTLATVTDGSERSESLEKFSGLPVQSQIKALDALHRSGVKNEELARDIILTLKDPGNDSYGARLQAVASITPEQSHVWKELSHVLNQQGADAAASGAMYLKDLQHPPAEMATWALESMRTKAKHLPWFSSLLAKTDLSREQISKIADQIVADPNSDFSASLRYVVRNQRNAEFTSTQRQALEGNVDAVECEPSGSSIVCRLIRQ